MAESRLQQRGWSSLGGCSAWWASSSVAEARRAGFLSIARPRKERMAGLQSSATSSMGGASLWIWGGAGGVWRVTGRLSDQDRKGEGTGYGGIEKATEIKTSTQIKYVFPECIAYYLI